MRVLDDFSTGSRENLAGLEGDLDLREASIEDLDAVLEATRECDVVYHQAALGSVPRSVSDPLGSHRVNATGTLHVLEAARRNGVGRLVYAASSSAYGDTETLPKIETMPPRPLSPYALQKLVGEIYCRQYTELYGLETVALRYFNVYGPRQSPDSTYAAVIPLFFTALRDGKRPRVFGDGHQSRDFTYVEDAVAANRAAAVAPGEATGEVYNVARGGRTSLLQLLEAISRALGAGEVEPELCPARAGDVRHSQADVSKAERALGWVPRVALDEGIASTAAWFRTRVGR